MAGFYPTHPNTSVAFWGIQLITYILMYIPPPPVPKTRLGNMV